ncbi:hypothetical protein [Dongia sp.]|uniref:hypothetical protein n=1 Tax=Dongia sp. TaxID=1977262 RepID=UPI00375307CB
MRKLLPALVALTFCAASAHADPVITDQKAAKQLLGKHALTLQWIGSGTLKDAGSAEVKQDGGRWLLTGKMEAKEGLVSLDGEVTKIEKSTFTFKGKIVTKVFHIYEGKECPREVEVIFERKGGRKYWRMYPIDNPCEAVADYIDIYLR